MLKKIIASIQGERKSAKDKAERERYLKERGADLERRLDRAHPLGRENIALAFKEWVDERPFGAYGAKDKENK